MDSQESARQTFSKNFGLVTAISARDLPWGGWTTLKNLQGITPGEMRTRKGLAPASDYTGTPGSNAILSLSPYDSPLGPTVITHDAGGAIKARRANSSISLATGFSTDYPVRTCRTRDGQLIIVNGLQRGKIWTGANASAFNLGIDPPTAAIDPSDASLDSGGGLSAGDYLVTYRYVDRSNHRTDPTYSEMAPVLSLTATDGQEINFDLTGFATAPGRGTHVQVWRSTVAVSSVFYLITEQAIASASTYVDQYTDQQLIDAASEDPEKFTLLRGRYGAVMRRFSPPPKDKSVAVQFRDITFYAVDVPYETGTVSITSSDATVTGSGTSWISDFAGRYLWIDGANKPYVIDSVTNGTSLELTANAAESLSGKSYKILPDPADRNAIYHSSPDEPESVNATFVCKIQSAAEDDDQISALMPFGNTMLIFKHRHTYHFTFSKFPSQDGNAQYAFARGCLGQECWDILGSYAYVLDATGAYAVSHGGGPESISDVIQDYWRDGTIDFSAAKWFRVNANPATQTVRFFVKFTTDTSDRPMRALCYHTVQKTWWEEEYACEFGGACRVDEDGEVRTVVGANHDRLYYLDEGQLDGCSTAIVGTATSATSSTLSDSTAPFGSSNGLIGASVVIADGTGFGQAPRRITANTSSQLTVTPNWTTTPSTDSKYVVGGATYEAKSGYQPIIDQARKEQEITSLHLEYTPIADDLPLRVRQFWDFDAAAETYGSAGNSPDRLVSWEAGSTDKKVNLHLTAKVDDAGNGTNRGRVTVFDYSKATGSRLQGKSAFAVELEGTKADEAVVLHRIDLSGTGKG